MLEVDGKNKKYNLLRRVSRSFVDAYIPLSMDLAMWLRDEIGVPERKIVQIYNGVDTHRFHPARTSRATLPLADFAPPGTIVIGSVGRLAAVKDPTTLVRAFVQLLDRVPHGRERLRLVLVGDGPLRPTVERVLKDAEVQDISWLAGSREDIPELLRGFDVFALPSLAEGISNTILEAMATGLPVVATSVGGTPELVTDGASGRLVPPSDRYIDHPSLIAQHGQAGCQRVEHEFGIDKMVNRYQAVYDALLKPITTDH
jgi:sugar transferase (PEP-CTERM/EpsH1 system associated)